MATPFICYPGSGWAVEAQRKWLRVYRIRDPRIQWFVSPKQYPIGVFKEEDK
jgi:hypothetical protein